MADAENTPERWLLVVGLEHRYEVSSIGRFRSIGWRRADGQFIKPKIFKTHVVNGYTFVNPLVNGVRRTLYLHREVLKAFVRPPLPNEDCNHLDFNRSNNRIDNLEWTSRSGNIMHSAKAGRIHKTLEPSSVSDIRKRYAMGESQESIAADFPISQSQVSRIVRRIHWPHVA